MLWASQATDSTLVKGDVVASQRWKSNSRLVITMTVYFSNRFHLGHYTIHHEETMLFATR
jgi:hypothetical protein